MEKGQFQRRHGVGGHSQEELGLAGNKVGTGRHSCKLAQARESGSSSKTSVPPTGSGQRLAPQELWLTRIQGMGMPLDR